MAKTMKRQSKIKNGFYKGYVDRVALRRKAEKEAKKSGKAKENILKVFLKLRAHCFESSGISFCFFFPALG